MSEQIVIIIILIIIIIIIVVIAIVIIIIIILTSVCDQRVEMDCRNTICDCSGTFCVSLVNLRRRLKLQRPKLQCKFCTLCFWELFLNFEFLIKACCRDETLIWL